MESSHVVEAEILEELLNLSMRQVLVELGFLSSSIAPFIVRFAVHRDGLVVILRFFGNIFEFFFLLIVPQLSYFFEVDIAVWPFEPCRFKNCVDSMNDVIRVRRVGLDQHEIAAGVGDGVFATPNCIADFFLLPQL